MPNWKTWLRRIITATTVTTVIFVLLGWGAYALQWTTPTNDLQTVALHQWSSYTFQYRITPGSEQDFRVGLEYPSRSPSPNQINAIINESNVRGYIDYGLRSPTSTPWSYTVNYIIMSYSPSQTYNDINQPVYRERVWFEGPQGNLTKTGDVGYFEVISPANYTIHIFNPPPPEAYLNATGTAALTASIVEYSHPYYNYGLVTVGVAGAFATVFPSFTAYGILKHRQRSKRE